MNVHPKIPTAYASTVKAREPHDPEGNCCMPPVPETMDGIFDELSAKAMEAVEGRAAAERVMVKRPGVRP